MSLAINAYTAPSLPTSILSADQDSEETVPPTIVKVRRRRPPLALINNPLIPHIDDAEASIDGSNCSPKTLPDGVKQPIFRIHKKASGIELFFDLFFVANLTTFTSFHEINTPGALASYVAFFGLLWFTWLQITLYEVRFTHDSFFERVFKMTHLGVLVGFAVVGPNFRFAKEISLEEEEGNEDVAANTWQALRTMSLLLMASRLALALQYLSVLWFARHHKTLVKGLVCVIATLFISAMVYLGVYFAYIPEHLHQMAFVAWYVSIALEGLTLFAVSIRWRILSFKRTHLNERMELLTLIILGEGIIGLMKSCTDIVDASGFKAATIGQIIASVLIIYFLWMLYFDQRKGEKLGSIRQQIWALLHFPLHAGLVLAGEGCKQFITWAAIQETEFSVGSQIYNQMIPSADGNSTMLAQNYKLLFEELTTNLQGISFLVLESTNVFIDQQIGILADSGNYLTNITAQEPLSALYRVVYILIYQTYGVEVPWVNVSSTDTLQVANNGVNGVISIYVLVFTYIFVAAGFILIMLGITLLYGKKEKDMGHKISGLARFVVGVGMAMMVFMTSAKNKSPFEKYILSPWTLPTVCGLYGCVLCLDNVVEHIWFRKEVREIPGCEEMEEDE